MSEHKDECPTRETKDSTTCQKSESISEVDKQVSTKIETADGTNNDINKCEIMDETETPPSGNSSTSGETTDFKMVWNKQNYNVTFELDKTVEDLKKHIEELTGIPPNMQKLMYKGLIKDHSATLRDVKITKGAKLMVVGSTLKDVLKVTPPPPGSIKDEKTSTGATSAKEPLCRQKMHKKVLDKGKPDDVMPGYKGIKNGFLVWNIFRPSTCQLSFIKDRLPSCPLTGMHNKLGGKVRLTFKLELDQLWIGTKERTEKLPMSSIRNVISEAIEGHEEYHLMAIQLGPTEASRCWIYWVPAQYVDAIKDTILGKWQSL